MTYATVQKSRVFMWNSKNFVRYDYDIAVGDESIILEDEYERSVEHYILPISTQWASPIIRFYKLKAEWEFETAHLSSITEIAMHHAYQQIIGMGPIAIPLIFDELRKKLGHWFWALKAISGEDPVLPEHRGRIKLMTEDWLQWGEKQGYIK